MSDNKVNPSKDESQPSSSSFLIGNKVNNENPNEIKGLESSSENDVFTLIHEGDGVFSMDPEVERKLESLKGDKPNSGGSSSGTTPKTDVGQRKEKKTVVENLNSVDSTHQEDYVLRLSETSGNVHQRLEKETDCGKSFKVVIICAASSMRLFHDPKFTRNLIDESIFGKHLRGPIEVRGKGRSIKILIDSNAVIDVSKIKRLGDYPIQAWCPLNLNHRVGVVSPVDISIDIDTEFTPYLKLDSDSKNICKIIEVKRMRKYSDLPCVKVVFEGDILPKKVIYDNTVLSVRPFLHNPILCFKCRNYGHGASSCTNKITCPHCLANHTWNECSQLNAPKCLHCKLDHETGSNECDFFTQASTIENLKRDGKISYEESKKLYKVLNNCNIIQVRNDIDRNILRGYVAPMSKTDRSSYSPNDKSKECNIKAGEFLPLSNRYDILNSTIDELESNENEPESPKEIEKVNRPNFVEGRLNKNIQRHKRMSNRPTYAQRLKSSDYEVVTDDSFNLNSSSEQVNVPANHNKSKIKHNRDTIDSFNLNSSSEQVNVHANLDKSRIKLNFENIKKIPLENKVKNAKSLADCFISDNKDSFLYQLLNRIHRFYETPNKTGFQWLSFLMDLLDFVGQYKEVDQ